MWITVGALPRSVRVPGYKPGAPTQRELRKNADSYCRERPTSLWVLFHGVHNPWGPGSDASYEVSGPKLENRSQAENSHNGAKSAAGLPVRNSGLVGADLRGQFVLRQVCFLAPGSQVLRK